jgi:hypothetical protein
MKYKNEIKVLLEILKGEAGVPVPMAGINTGVLLRLAERHKVSSRLLVYAQAHAGMLSPEETTALETRCRTNAIRSLGQLHELIRVTKELQEAGIPFAMVKGPQLSRMVYGREAMKESVDLDVMLTKPGDLARAHATLRAMGYTWSNLDALKSRWKRQVFIIAKREIQYLNPALRSCIDLHLKPGTNTYLTARRFRDFFNDLVAFPLEGTDIPVLPPEKYFVYLCYHGALHQFSRLDWLMDIRAFLILRRDKLDIQKVLAIARALHAEKSLFLAMYLLERYVGEAIPAEISGNARYRQLSPYLTRVCTAMIGQNEDYWMTFGGRTDKVLYIMVLTEGLAAKIDWLYGILMRFVAKRM